MALPSCGYRSSYQADLSPSAEICFFSFLTFLPKDPIIRNTALPTALFCSRHKSCARRLRRRAVLVGHPTRRGSAGRRNRRNARSGSPLVACLLSPTCAKVRGLLGAPRLRMKSCSRSFSKSPRAFFFLGFNSTLRVEYLNPPGLTTGFN